MKKTVLRGYAALIARSGVNIRKGQDVIINAELDQPEFVKMLVEECYKAGARKVVVDWSYQPLTAVHVRHCTVATLGELPKYEEARWQYYTEALPCRIYLLSEDPDGLKHLNNEKLAKGRQKKFPLIKGYRDQIENRYQWCIAAVPGKAWARKLFPGLRASAAEEKLWEAILSCSRATEDPIAAWEAHNRDLHARCDALNTMGITALHYTSARGTDLTVGMIPEAEFKGGDERSKEGVVFNPNIPSEEVFISPMRGKAEGVVYATMPLCYEGQIIDGFSVRFQDGKAVEWHAEKGEDLLGRIITMDEGSGYLGECALVPTDSPIAESGLLFWNTLFDENASCHLALGMGFADTIRGYEDKSLEDCRALGVNDSMVHEDFMIGDDTLDIDGVTADGRTVPIFRGGRWAV